MSRCPRCPVMSEMSCLGEKARRLCDLVNPGHPAYHPRYVERVVDASASAIIAQVNAARRSTPNPNAPGPCGSCP